jgi:hypothetical protein
MARAARPPSVTSRLILKSCSEFVELVEQLVEPVPGNHHLAVELGDAGLDGAEPAVSDDHVWVPPPEKLQPQQLAGIFRSEAPMPAERVPGCHGRPSGGRGTPALPRPPPRRGDGGPGGWKPHLMGTPGQAVAVRLVTGFSLVMIVMPAVTFASSRPARNKTARSTGP